MKLKAFVFNGQVVDPLKIALLKQRANLYEIPTISETGVQYMKMKYPFEEGAVSVYSLFEAVNGRRSEGSTSIVLNTSAGYPFSLQHIKGKTSVMYREDDVLKLTPEFLEHLEEYHQAFLSGKIPPTMWSDNFKDETRLKEKVFAGKTRLFSAGPIDHLILFRMYFLSAFMYMRKSRLKAPVAIGLNVHSREWQMLFMRLNRFASEGESSLLASDVENFDGTIHEKEVFAFLDFIQHLYRDEFYEVRKGLMMCVIHSTHIIFDIVYITHNRIPSGFGGTAEFNSIINAMRLATVAIDDFKCNEDEFELTVYGDDSVLTSRKPDLTYEDLQLFMKNRYNAKYTHWSKESNVGKDTIFDIRYLGRKFVPEEGLIRAPLDERVIVEMLYWTRQSDEVLTETTMLSTVDSFFVESSHLGFAAYMENSEMLAKFIVDNKLNYIKDSVASRWHSYQHYLRTMYYSETFRYYGPANGNALF